MTRKNNEQNMEGILNINKSNNEKINSIQYKIYKINTFNFFSKEENDKYNEIKKSKVKMSAMESVLEKFTNQRVLNSKALIRENELQGIAIYFLIVSMEKH